jgi:tryptophan-rich sensory protein
MHMQLKKFKPYILSILIALAVGALGGIVTSSGMPAFDQITKPYLTPPSFIFPIVWTVLYVLMGVSAAIIWKSNDDWRGCALSIYSFQLLVNGLWPILFFGLQAYFLSFLWLLLLWLLILIMIWCFSRVNRAAALLQIPYLLWVSFAGYLNLMIWLLNR